MSNFALTLLLLIAYTYAGYPLLVALWARLRPRRESNRSGYEPSVSVCLAVSNGAKHIAQKIESIGRVDYPPEKLEILICSDGSTDETAQIVERYRNLDPRIRLLENPKRVGKPAALNRLKAEARGEVLVMTDVRQTITPNAIRALVEPLADLEVGCVSGTLVLTGKNGAGAYWRYERFIRGSESRLGSMTGVSGSLYAIRRSEFPVLPENVILDDMFVPLRLALAKKRIILAERAEAYDESFEDEREFYRKVRTLAGNYQLVALMPALLVPGRNPTWFQIVSHKLLRLVCPWALLLLFVISTKIALDPPPELGLVSILFWRTLVLGQVLFYALAALGGRAGRLAALARTFVILNAAAVVGLWRFVRGAQPVTW